MWLALIALGKKIPWQLYACTGVLLSLWGFGTLQYHRGASDIQDKWDASVTRGKVVVKALKDKQGLVTHTIETVYVDRVKTVKEKGSVIVQQVPMFVPANSCELSGGLRVFHDAAAANTLPDTSRIADAKPVPAGTLATTVAENYSICHQAFTELAGLREWVTAQRQVYLDQCASEPGLCSKGK